MAALEGAALEGASPTEALTGALLTETAELLAAGALLTIGALLERALENAGPSAVTGACSQAVTQRTA